MSINLKFGCKKFLLTFLLLFLVSSASVSYAGQDLISPKLNKSVPAAAETKLVQEIYVEPTWKNYMKLYARLGLLDTAKPIHLDQYLAASECPMFTKFRTNEFEWARIRIAAQQTIEKDKSNFSNRIEFVLPIMLSEFDFAKGGFPLTSDNIITPITKIQIGNSNFGSNECRMAIKKSADYLSTNAVLSVDRPFSLTFVPSDQTHAQQYLNYIETNNVNISDGRPAYLKFRVRVDRLIESKPEVTDDYALFYGQIESIAVYGDRDQMIKIYEQNFL